MSFWRSIAVSFLLHGAILGYAYVQIDSTADLQFEPSVSDVVVDDPHVEFGTPSESDDPVQGGDQSQSEFVSMDLEAGLDGDPKTTPDDRTKPEPRDESSVSEQHPGESAPNEPSSAGASESQEPAPEASTDAVVASEESESDREVPDRSAQPTAPSETESSSADPSGSNSESGASPAGEERVAERGSGGSGDSGNETGSGSGATGRGGGEEGSGRSGVDRGKLIRGYTRTLHRRLAEKKYYPSAARRAGIEGTVRVEVTIDAEGQILSIKLHESSGHDILDRAALKILRSLEKFPKPPEALAWSEKRLRVPIPYQLDSRG